MPRKQEQDEHQKVLRGNRCSWVTDGSQCFLSGSISPDIGDHTRRYCHWHYVCLHRPEDRGKYDEFCRWNAAWAGYCSEENHHPDTDLWAAIQGRSDLGRPSKWCGLLWCRHFPEKLFTTTAKPITRSRILAVVTPITTERSPTQRTPEELDRQKVILRDMAGRAVQEEVPF